MTLREMKDRVLSLIEEINPESEYLTDDPDIQEKINYVIDMKQHELARVKRLAASDIIAHKQGIIKFFTSQETWFGMTYPEDRQLVKDEIAKKIKDGYYPEKLWER